MLYLCALIAPNKCETRLQMGNNRCKKADKLCLASVLPPASAGRPLACVSPRDLSRGRRPARTPTIPRAAARCPRLVALRSAAVRRRRGSAREVAISLLVIGLRWLLRTSPAAPAKFVLQGQRHWRRPTRPFIRDDARRAPARRPRAPGPGRMRGRAARVFPLRWVGRKKTGRKRTTH